MRIVEHQPFHIKIFKGHGAWAVFTPARFCLSMIYRIWLLSREKRIGKAAGAAPGAAARIISIGNIEVGGGGKTPCTISLAEYIEARGGRPVVVTRGYRSLAAGLKKCPFVVTAGREVRNRDEVECNIDEEFFRTAAGREYSGDQGRLARLIGDEPVLYRNRGIPVVIDKKRARGADAAVRLFHPTHILLDDAFQHRSIHRDLDILLLDALRPFGDKRLLPFGTLRERPEAARRAHVLIFTRAQGGKVPDEALPYIDDRPVFFATHEPVNLIGRDNSAYPFSLLEGRSVVLISGVARPGSFEELVGRAGIRPEISFRFTDHHDYSAQDVERVTGASPEDAVFLTTEKDWGKLANIMPPGVVAYAVRISMEIRGAEELMDIVSPW